MAHPLRFAEDDPHLARVREICLALPEAAEKISHGHPNFFTRKVFAVFGGVVKGDHGSEEYADSMLFLPDREEREALLGDERFFVPAYYGPGGWLGINLRTVTPDWAEVAELADMSYRNTATARLVRELDARA
ncbi:MmcQ/YjbR family DNA-binding protein [Enemella evansiae]|uniref:MmcQ/YjbR family DNA-binding protein n=1 Tax=Enemella evansiae TaxID=2016499 RepID=UPI00105CCF36|nr:MmcQ/YjbR family DNA-binding protein [Enemella evansiae]TDO91769.1 YjbR protein [Enemella evansiae]